MKRPFEVGDRVRCWWVDDVYGNIGPHCGDGNVVEVKTIENGGETYTVLVVTNGDGFITWVQPQQCRRLVKKPRRRVWVSYNELGHWSSFNSTPPSTPTCQNGKPWVEFIELRRKK